jgi:hypothetical protein
MVFSFLWDVRAVTNMVRDVNDTVREVTESEEERKERIGKTNPLYLYAGVVAVALFFFALGQTANSMDEERERSAAEQSEPKPKVDCSKNPWGIGCGE